MQPVRLSVVVPCLNARSTIERTLASLAGQDAPPHEVVVVDGGSTDGTVELLESTEGIRFVSEPDRGLSDAVNKGVGLATGDVIGWLNADDAYLPGALRRVQDAWAAADEPVWLTGQCLIVDGDGREIRRAVTRYKNALLRRYGHRLYLTQNFVSAPSTFFARSAFFDVGAMDVDLRYAMDYDLYLRLARVADPVVLHEPLAAFTMAEGTLSMSGFERQFAEHRDIAQRYRADGPVAASLNRLSSAGIVTVYRLLRARRQRQGAARAPQG